MNILITLPAKTNWSDYEQELAAVADCRSVLNFRIPSMPQNAAAGDKCYLAYRGYLVGWMFITDIVKRDGFQCATTGVNWEPGIYIQRAGPFYYVQRSILCKGFQGYRYMKTDIKHNWE